MYITNTKQTPIVQQHITDGKPTAVTVMKLKMQQMCYEKEATDTEQRAWTCVGHRWFLPAGEKARNGRGKTLSGVPPKVTQLDDPRGNENTHFSLLLCFFVLILKLICKDFEKC